jgi:hypothetical protein
VTQHLGEIKMGKRIGKFAGVSTKDQLLSLVDGGTASGFVKLDGNTGLSAGTGITGGTDTVYKSWIEHNGGIVTTYIYIDMDGLIGAGGAKDVIGKVGTANCHLGQYTTAKMGTLFAGRMTCLEVVAGGEPDIDLYSSNVATGTENVAYDHSDMGTETALLTAGQDWIAALSANQFNTAALTALPTADDYFYLTKGANASTSEYTAGKFLIELWGAA